jgi:hypothetical protein
LVVAEFALEKTPGVSIDIDKAIRATSYIVDAVNFHLLFGFLIFIQTRRADGKADCAV